MSYCKDIEIYKIKGDLRSPSAAEPDRVVNCNVGDHVIIIDDEVWIRDWDSGAKAQFSKPSYNAKFVRMNPTIFEKEIQNV